MRTLLILGATEHESLLARRCRQAGFRVIVTDNRPEGSPLSPARAEADAWWGISWSDIPALAQACRREGVSAVMAGFSEFRQEARIRLCAELGLPCDVTSAMLGATRHKLRFKRECGEYGLPVVEDASEECRRVLAGAPMRRPLVVKPADRAGSIGVRVVRDAASLASALEEAGKLSVSGDTVVEPYMEGVKFDAYCMMQRGKLSLVASDDTEMLGMPGHEICQTRWTFPSAYEEAWLRRIHPALERMLLGLGLQDGYIAISAFSVANGGDTDFRIFECGLRLSGECSFDYTEAAYGVSYLDYLILRAAGDNPPPADYSRRDPSVRMVVDNRFDLTADGTGCLLPLVSSSRRIIRL